MGGIHWNQKVGRFFVVVGRHVPGLAWYLSDRYASRSRRRRQIPVLRVGMVQELLFLGGLLLLLLLLLLMLLLLLLVLQPLLLLLVL